MLIADYIARYKMALPGFAGAWRVLCGHRRCSGELARLALVADAGSSDFFVTPVLPAQFARDAQGYWRQSTRHPRRPFRSGIDGVPSGLAAPLMAEESARVKMLLPLRLGPAGPPSGDGEAGLVIVCPRCGKPSAMRAADIFNALSALDKPWEMWEEGVREKIITHDH